MTILSHLHSIDCRCLSKQAGRSTKEKASKKNDSQSFRIKVAEYAQIQNHIGLFQNPRLPTLLQRVPEKLVYFQRGHRRIHQLESPFFFVFDIQLSHGLRFTGEASTLRRGLLPGVTDGKEPALLTAIRSGYVQPLPSLRAVGKRSNQGAVYQSKWRQDGDVMAETLMDSKQQQNIRFLKASTHMNLCNT